MPTSNIARRVLFASAPAQQHGNHYLAGVLMNDIYQAPEAELQFEQAAPYKLADRGERLVASIVDGLIIGVVTVPVMFLTGGFQAISGGEEPSLLYSFVLGGLGLVVFALVNFNLLKANGQTVGKKLLKIKIVTVDDRQAQLDDHLLKRYAVYFLPGQVPVVGQLFTIVNLLFIFGKERRCIHDLVGGTKVVKC